MVVVKINPRPGDNSTLLELNPIAAGEVDLTTGDTLTLKAGTAEITAGVTVSDDPAASNFIAAGLLHRLLLPTDQEFNLRLAKGQPVAVLGPVIGILISKNKKLKRPPFSRQKFLLQSFIAAGRKMGAVVYAFDPEGIDPEKKCIEGYYPNKTATAEINWKRTGFPFPDVVHNRIISRTTERNPLVSQAIKITSDYGSKCFNPKFLNKWETHNILSQNRELRKFLPETVRYESAKQLILFLQKHPLVYLKPWHGSLSKNILRICKEDNKYKYVHRQGKRTVSGVWYDVCQLAEAVPDFIGRRPYLMQQGLDLVTYFGRVFDIRVLVQKNLDGCWIVTATVARVGKAGSPFPNIAAGGSALTVEQVWQELFNRDWLTSSLREEIDRLAKLVAVTLDENLGNFGEMGLDIGLDHDGRPWLIEVNSKPSRKVFPPGEKALKAQSIRLPMEYALYLAGFTGEQLSGERENE